MATHNHTSSRRRALTLGVGTLAAAAIGATQPAFAAPNDDTDLIRFCAEFDALERELQALTNSTKTTEEDHEIDPIAKRLRERQEPLLDRICALPSHTPAGASALAASLVLWEAGEVQVEDDPDCNMNERLLSALLRGVIGRA